MRFASAALAALLCFAAAAAASGEALERALSLAAEARYAEAREALDPILEREPRHPRARLLDGVLKARTGRVSDAINVFNALLRDHPDMFEPYNNLAVLYAVQGRLDEARETLLAALEHQPAAVVYANLGDVYADLARRAYLRARALEPGGEARPETPAGAAPETAAGEAGASREAASSGEARDGILWLQEAGSIPAAEGATDAPAPAGAALVATGGGVQDGGVLELREAESIPAEGAEAAPAPSGACARAGGFEDFDAASGALRWLRARGADQVAVRLEEERRVTSWRVYLPPLGNYEQAAAKVREIQGRGVHDVGIIGEGDLTNGISFGVYQDEDNMRRRVATLRALGFPVQSASDLEIVDRYVVEARAPAAFDAEWKTRFPDRPLQPVPCRRLRASP